VTHVTDAKRVLIAEDHPAMRDGLRKVVERDGDMVVVAAAADGVQAAQLHKALRPDITLIDLQMPKLDGLGAIAAIREFSPAACFVVLTSFAGDARVRRALNAGVRAFVLKTSPSAVLRAALRDAHDGRLVLDPAISTEPLERSAGEQLTTRELNALQLVAQGNSNARIGRKLSITEHAVKARLKKILNKLDAQDRAEAVTIARERGFIDC
jgi:DNA-binding NarL/FixJ family response regulator